MPRRWLSGRPTLQAAPVLPANALLRGVPLPTPGRHLVEFHFRPRSVGIGGGISLGSLAILGLVWWRRQKGIQSGSAGSTGGA